VSTLRSTDLGQVDVQALADLIRAKTAELVEVAALFTERTARPAGAETREAQR
jgi:hypothetical protein